MDASKSMDRLANRPTFPSCLSHVWTWFCELDSARQSGMGINPISYTEVASWAQLRGIRPMPFEVKCIKALDVARMEHSNGR